MVWIRCITLLFISIPAFAFGSERGRSIISSYDSQVIGASSLNNNVLELPGGKIAIANAKSLMIFDGQRWRTFDHPQDKEKFNDFSWDQQSRLYGGVFDELGYFAFDAKGDAVWTSLMPMVPAEVQDFGAVLSVLYDQSRQGVWFLTASKLIWFDARQPQRSQIWTTKIAFKRLFQVGGEVWFSAHGEPMMRVVGDNPINIEIVSGLEDAKFDNVVNVIERGSDQILLAADGRLFKRQNNVTIPIGENVFPQLSDALPVNFVGLADGRFVVKSKRHPLAIMAADFSSLEYFQRDRGTDPSKPSGLLLDSQGGIWNIHLNIIARVDLASGLTQFNRDNGLSSAHILARINGVMYAGTGTGIFKLKPALGTEAASFIPVWPEITAAYGLAQIDSTLFVAGAGLYRVDTTTLNPPERINNIPRITSVVRSRFHPDRLWAATYQGLIEINQARAKQPEVAKIKGLDADLSQVIEQDENTLWAANGAGGLWRIQRINGLEQVEAMEGRPGLPPLQVRLSLGREHIWFATNEGIRLFDATTKTFYSPKNFPNALVQNRVFSLNEDAHGNLWFRSGNVGTGVAWRDGDGWRIDTHIFSAVDTTPTFNSFHFEDQIVWATRPDGVIRLDLKQNQKLHPSVVPVVSAVRDLQTGAPMNLSSAYSLTHQERNLAFEFAQANWHRPEKTLYRSRLMNFDERWSDWSARADRDYTNLPSGNFQFAVEAKDSYGRIQAMAPVPIRVASPWWLSIWAYGFYGLLGGILLWMAARFGARRRQRELLIRQGELEALVQMRTEELIERNSQLAEQAIRLTEVDRLKTRFFINVGHEFRTPLSLVLGPIDDLLRDAKQSFNQKVREQLEMANRNARRVLDLIVELLDVNRFEHGQMRLQLVRTDLELLIKNSVFEHQSLLERFGHQVTIKTELNAQTQVSGSRLSPWLAMVDPAQIERCVSNLISNAAKYMARGGSIEILLRAFDQSFEVWINDQGRGIAASALPHVFDRFFQTEEADSASGYGIGLALVREIIEAHHGSIKVESSVGTGSRFCITLPRMEADLILIEPKVVTTDSSHGLLQNEISAESKIEMISPGEESNEPDSRALILIVDDHDDLRVRVKSILANRYQVIEANDGPSAWNVCRDKLPDVIVCDVMMPGFDGIELTRRIRANPDTAAIAMLLLTAKVGSEHTVEGLHAGADDYLSKPFDSSELLARVGAMLARAQRLRLRLMQESTAPSQVESNEANSENKWLKRLHDLLARNLHEPQFDVEQMAQNMHLNRSQLFRKCKDLLAMSPSEYLRDLRLKRAYELLEAGAGNISEIAYAVGFDSLSSFTRAFKTRFAVPPSHVANARKTG